MKTSNLKKLLLTGSAIVAVAAFAPGAHAADTEAAAAAATPTNMLTGFTAGDDFLNTTDNANDFGTVDANGDVSVGAIDSDFTGGLSVYDSDTTADSTVAVSTYMDVANGSTFTLVFGDVIATGAGTSGAGPVFLTIGTTLGEAGATTLTRGGTLAIVGATDESSGLGTFSVAGNTLMTNIDVTGGAGGDNESGTAVAATFGDSSSDTFNVTTLDVTGGAGDNSVDAKLGAAATVTINGAATVGGAITVTGGEADSGNGAGTAGGNASLTFANGATLGSTVTVTGGSDDADDAAAHGGDASVTFTGDVTSTSTLALVGGAQAGAASGLAGDALATITGNATFTAITMDDTGADAAVGITFDGTSAQTIAGTIDGVGAAEGSLTIANSAGVTFTGIIGTTQDVALITIAKTAANSSATFKAQTGATAIVLGDGANTDTNTLTFDGTAAGFAVDGTINGTAGDTNNVVITGGNTITTSGIVGGNTDISDLALTGSGTKLTAGADINAATVTIGNGTTLDANDKIITTGAVTIASTGKLDVGADSVTATGGIANSGTIQQTGTGAIGANITGTGTLDIDESATYTGNVAATSADIAASKVLTIGGANTYAVGTTTFNDATAGLTVTAGADITGNLVAATDGFGDLEILDAAATTVITGNVGTSEKALATMSIDDANGGSGAVVQVTGNLYVDAIDSDNADSTLLQFTGTSTQTVSGTVNDGMLTFNAGTDVIFNSDLTSIDDVDNNGAVYFKGDAAVTDYDNTGGTTRIAVNKTLTAGGTFTPGTGSFIFDVSDADGTLGVEDFGKLNATGAVDTDTTSFRVTGFLGTGAVDILTTATFDEAEAIVDNSALYTFTAAVNGTVTVARESSASITRSAGAANTLDQLLSIGAAATGELDTVLDAAVSAGADTVGDVVEAAASDVAGGAVVAGLNVANQTSGVTNTRLAALRDGTAMTGMSAGSVSEGVSVWGQVFGQTAEQDERDGVSGYDADTIGFAVGADTENLGDNLTLGVALSYAETEVESDAISNAKTDVDSYQITLYGDYDIDSRTYVSGQLGYIYGDNETTRNPGGVSSLTATGDYDSSTITAGLELGRDYDAGGNLTLTPKVSANYTHYSAEDYTETGAGTANLVVDADDLNLFEVGLGVDAAWVNKNADGSYLKPVLSAGVRHDLIGDEFEATNTFTGAGTSFQVEGFDPAQTTFDLGGSLTYFSTDNWELSASYDFEVKSDYAAHAGLLKAAYKF